MDQLRCVYSRKCPLPCLGTSHLVEEVNSYLGVGWGGEACSRGEPEYMGGHISVTQMLQCWMTDQLKVCASGVLQKPHQSHSYIARAPCCTVGEVLLFVSV